jgi:enamine deaminase RidA (YjgF/YER057c/UK114 family)
VIHNDLLTTSGQVAETDQGESVEIETTRILAKIDAILVEGGTHRSRLLHATIYLANMNHFEEMNISWEKWVDPLALPTRTTIVTPMTRPEWRVAIAVTAYVPSP